MNTPPLENDKNRYVGIRIFDALHEIEKIKDELRTLYPEFNFVNDKGDVAEAYAIYTYGLKKAPVGQTGFDAITTDGRRVSIKCLWEQNPYRSLHLSGGSNRKEFAYKDADVLLVVGRDEITGRECTIYNGPMSRLEPFLKGGPIHPRIDVRTLRKIYVEISVEERLAALVTPLPDVDGLYYPKDLHILFDIDPSYWSKFTMLWRNYPCRYQNGVELNDFLDFGIGNGTGNPLLSSKDVKLLVLCYNYYLKEYDHHTSVFAAYGDLVGKPLPNLIKISSENLKSLRIATSTLKQYAAHPDIRKYFSWFFLSDLKGPGGRSLTRYLTPHDLKIFQRSFELRGRKSTRARGSVTDKLNFIDAGILAAKEIGYAPVYELPSPKSSPSE